MKDTSSNGRAGMHYKVMSDNYFCHKHRHLAGVFADSSSFRRIIASGKATVPTDCPATS